MFVDAGQNRGAGEVPRHATLLDFWEMSYAKFAIDDAFQVVYTFGVPAVRYCI